MKIKLAFFLLYIAILSSCNNKVTKDDFIANSVNISSIKNPYSFSGNVYEKYESGEIKQFGAIKKGKKDGEWTTLYKSGNTKQKVFYNLGFIDKYIKMFYENGQISNHLIYKKQSASIEGFSQKHEWYKNSNKKYQLKQNDKLQKDLEIFWDENGDMTSFLENKKYVSTFITFFPNKKKKTESIKNIKKQTLLSEVWDSTGILRYFEFHSLNENGTLVKNFYPNGKLKSIGHKKLKRDDGPVSKGIRKETKNGSWYYYKQNGDDSLAVTYRFGDIFGTVVKYNNGIISSIEEIRVNQNFGIKTEFKDNQETKKTLFYKKHPLDVNVQTIFSTNNNNRDILEIRNTFLGLYHKITPSLKNIKNDISDYKGIITLKFKVLSNGKIKNCEVKNTTIKNTFFVQEIAKAISKWEFPKTPNGSTEITYPIEFF